MILSSKSLLEAYKADIGDMGGDDSTEKASPAFDRVVMVSIILVGLAVGAVGVIGLYNNLMSNSFGMTLLSLLLALAGVSSALGVYREFVSMTMISRVLGQATEETSKEMVQIVLEKDRNMALVGMLLSVLEGIFGDKGQAKSKEELK